ncbi:MAG: type IV secretion system DNA-binding domain-containing protein [Candidatus Nomurabacteria bacterium]|jgi:hypothetical protein|nr:type IV secretion system DNA-binding domain-containing protein [Candidatus Nomurabacteria bacterium]
MIKWIITSIISVAILIVAIAVVWSFFVRKRQKDKNYERGLKMVPMLIHLPPEVEDIDGGSRDERDVTDESLSQAQSMYNIISSIIVKKFSAKIYGQKHLSFEILAVDGLIYYYAVVPVSLIDMVRQAVSTAYPTARLEEVRMHNIFNKDSGSSGIVGGELSLKKEFVYPISTYQEIKQDPSRALLNALSAVKKGDGMAVQILFRPADEKWFSYSKLRVKEIREHKKKKGPAGSFGYFIKDLSEALWKPPEVREKEEEEKEVLTNLEQAEIEAIETKTKYPGFETLVRVIASSPSAERSKALLSNVVAAFALVDSTAHNGFQYRQLDNTDKLATDYILHLFPIKNNKNILNSVELSTIFHLPSQKDIPTSQVKRQMAKQVDGPTDVMDEGLFLGVNEFRGKKKEIRLSSKDRVRHTYIIGQTGTGKSNLMKNLAYQDMMEGRGFAMIDPHGDLAEDILGMVPPERVDDIIYFNPSDKDSPIGLNMFEIDNPDQMDFVIGEMISMFYSLYDPGHTGIVGPRMENVIRYAAVLIMSAPGGGTFMDIPKVLVDPEFTKSKIKYLTDARAIDFWTKEWPNAQRSNDAGEVTAWIVSKWSPFENQLIRNILGQSKSGFNIREVMDSGKILLVNLSKGLLGEHAAKLLGMVFVMKFQSAAMGRADMPEEQRRDFCLYVDEFQNFATDSFESILSEARKYKLNLIVANQFMTQLTDKIREAIIGNVGTVMAGRIGITDAEILQKKFQPTFTADDLTKLPNYQAIASVMIHNVPSAPFSMNWVPQIGTVNEKIRESMRLYSATKYGRSRAEVVAEISARLGAVSLDVSAASGTDVASGAPSGASKDGTAVFGGQANPPRPANDEAARNRQKSFLNDWLDKKKKLAGDKAPAGVPPKEAPSGGLPPQKTFVGQNTPAGAPDNAAVGGKSTNALKQFVGASNEPKTGFRFGGEPESLLQRAVSPPQRVTQPPQQIAPSRQGAAEPSVQRAPQVHPPKQTVQIEKKPVVTQHPHPHPQSVQSHAPDERHPQAEKPAVPPPKNEHEMKFRIERTPEEKARIGERANVHKVKVEASSVPEVQPKPVPQPVTPVSAPVGQGQGGGQHHLDVRSGEHGEEHHIKLR